MRKILTTARQLWRDAPNWRRGVMAAGAVTLLALIPVGGNGGGGGGGGGQPPVAGPPPGGGGTYSGGGGGGGTVNPVGAVSQALACLGTRANHPAMQKAPEGQRCEGLVAAVGSCGVTEADLPRATPAQRDILDEVKTCGGKLEASDAHWAALAGALAEYGKRRSLAGAKSVASARSNLEQFDLDRAGTQDKAAAVKAADQAGADRDEALTLLTALSPLARLYSGADSQNLSTVSDLAEGYKKIGMLKIAIDPAELGAADREAVEAATDAARAIEESDRRIAALKAADARRAGEPLPYVRAVASLTEFDRARIAQGALPGTDLATIDKAVKSSLADAIDIMLGEYGRKTTLTAAAQLLRLQGMADAQKVELSGTARERLEGVAKDVAGHDKRMEIVRSVAADWKALRQRGGSDAGVEERVKQIMAAVAAPGTIELNSFDAGDVDAATKSAFAVLAQAFVEITGRLAKGGAGALAAYVDCSRISDRLIKPVCDKLSALLVGGGFRAGSAPGDSVISIALSNPALRDAGRDAKTGMPQRELKLAARLAWSYSGRSADLGEIVATGADRDLQTALDHVHSNAAKTIYERAMAQLGE
ncbi:MAG: hypothetical protein H6923_09010 [Alphaproteobacteria bacterium]|nr:hypothetical protein [Alphaproteobacteria bacterium]